MNQTVGIMTSEESFLNNYGAALQGYALQRVIRELGYQPEIIRYNGYGPKRRFGKIKDLVKKILKIRRGTLTEEQKKRNRALADIQKAHQSEIEEGREYFRAFQKETMTFYSDERMTWETLSKRPPLFDMYVCGSDQIWNPIFHGGICDRGYFLDFAPEGKKRIAYAPSLGTDSLPESCKAEMRQLIDKMSAVSVREQRGAELLEELTGRDIRAVLDPTLLLDGAQWAEIARRPEGLPEKYILCYRFSDNEQTPLAVKTLSEKTGLPVVSLPLSPIAMEDPFINIYKAGPREFIGLIEGAELVCTDSFHATVFSYLMNTPCLTFRRESYGGNQNSMNSRVVNLLQLLERTDRLVCREEDVDYQTLFVADYAAGKRNVEALRQESLSFLKKALGEQP
ncbi:MAG: polysaccharide pyruvyl transferase family protein [Clostridia bacterium]|nr:polysaccharide pyruvyl transferase family protein [Clostridia bacterium]